MNAFTTVIAVDREHLAELSAVWPTWQRWHPEIIDTPPLILCDPDLGPTPCVHLFEGRAWHRIVANDMPNQKDKMLGALLFDAPGLVQTDYWLKIDTDTVATGPGPPLTTFLDGVESIAASPWGYSKPVDALSQLDDWYCGITGEPPLEGVTYRPGGHSRERERCYYPRIIGWITIINTAFSRRVAEFLVKHPPPFISHDTLLWYLAERWKMPAKKIKFRTLGWDHKLGLRSIKETVEEVMKAPSKLEYTIQVAEEVVKDFTDELEQVFMSEAFMKANFPDFDPANSQTMIKDPVIERCWDALRAPAPASIPQTPEPRKRRRPCRGRGQEVVLANLLAETYGIKPIVGVEVGVYQAETSAHLLKHLPHLTMFLVDPWKEVVDKSLIGRDSVSGAAQATMDARRKEAYAATEPYRHRRIILEMPSVDAAKVLAGTQFDFVFIDAAHAYQSVRDDLAAWWPLVKPGGIFCGHDYGHRTHRGVKQAVDEFAAERGYELSALDATVWMIRK